MTLPVKKVYDGADMIGEAQTTGEVEELLVAGGLSRRAARFAVMTRLTEGRDAFHIITAAPVEEMCAAVRRVRGAA